MNLNCCVVYLLIGGALRTPLNLTAVYDRNSCEDVACFQAIDTLRLDLSLGIKQNCMWVRCTGIAVKTKVLVHLWRPNSYEYKLHVTFYAFYRHKEPCCLCFGVVYILQNIALKSSLNC